MAVANKVENITTFSYGQSIILTLKDPDPPHGAQDISSYTTRTVVVRSPDQSKTVTATASFVTDGTEGKISFFFADGDIDRHGKWSGQVKLEKTSVELRSSLFEMIVAEGLNT